MATNPSNIITASNPGYYPSPGLGPMAVPPHPGAGGAPEPPPEPEPEPDLILSNWVPFGTSTQATPSDLAAFWVGGFVHVHSVTSDDPDIAGVLTGQEYPISTIAAPNIVFGFDPTDHNILDVSAIVSVV